MSEGMEPPKRRMTILSMEAIFQNMDIEKIWDIRKGNMSLRRVLNEIPPKKLQKQFPIGTVDVEGQMISIRDGQRENRTEIERVSQTRWVSPVTLVLTDSNSRTIKTSILPVAAGFCRRMRSMEVNNTDDEEPEEYFNSLLNIIEVCPLMEAVGIHLKNMTEEHLSRLFDSFSLNRENDLASEFTISVPASTELTPAMVEKFLKTAGTRRRQLLIQEAQEGETLRLTNETIKKIFLTVPGDEEPWGHEQKILVERMDRQRTLDLIEELKVEYPTGTVDTSPQGGRRLAFYVFHDQWNKGFIVGDAF